MNIYTKTDGPTHCSSHKDKKHKLQHKCGKLSLLDSPVRLRCVWTWVKSSPWVIYTVTFSGAVERANSGKQFMTHSQTDSLILSSLTPFHSTFGRRKKTDKSVRMPHLEHTYDSLILQNRQLNTWKRRGKVFSTYSQTGAEEETGGAIGRGTSAL